MKKGYHLIKTIRSRAYGRGACNDQYIEDTTHITKHNCHNSGLLVIRRATYFANLDAFWKYLLNHHHSHSQSRKSKQLGRQHIAYGRGLLLQKWRRQIQIDGFIAGSIGSYRPVHKASSGKGIGKTGVG